MGLYLGSIGQGYSQGTQDASARGYQQAIIDQMRQKQQIDQRQYDRQNLASQNSGNVLRSLLQAAASQNQNQAPQLPTPPSPGQASVPMNPPRGDPSMGGMINPQIGGMAQGMQMSQGMPMIPPPPPSQPQIQPYTAPSAPQPPQSAMQGQGPQMPQSGQQIPPPPTQNPMASQGPQITFDSIANAAMSQGLQGQDLWEVIQNYAPLMDQQSKQQIAHLTAMLREQEIMRKQGQGDRRLDQSDRKIDQKEELIPSEIARNNRGSSGSKPQVFQDAKTGRTFTQQVEDNRIVTRDAQGNEVDTNSVSKKPVKGDTNTRNQMVRSAVANVKTAYEDILNNYGNNKKLSGEKKEAPRGSAFFGSDDPGLFERTIGRVWKSSEEMETDAKLSALLDEAIPALTGGLRASDSYRKFLIHQMPNKLDDNEQSAKTKWAVFMRNIEGIDHTFSDAFKNNKQFQSQGESASPEDAGDQDQHVVPAIQPPMVGSGKPSGTKKAAAKADRVLVFDPATGTLK